MFIGEGKSVCSVRKDLWLMGISHVLLLRALGCEKMTERRNKICHPDLGCSGNLNLSENVHTLNVGDLHSGRETGLAATDVECKSRNSHSSQNKGKPCTGRRAVVSQELSKEVEPMNIARKQRELAQLKHGTRIGNLYQIMCKKEWITQAMRNVLQNTGSNTAGMDGMVKKDYYRSKEGITATGMKEIEKICQELESQEYKPQPVMRIYIPKANGKERPLGIPTLRDRVVQESIRMVLEPIYESIFIDCSHGFRPNRSTKDAISICYQRINTSMKYYWVIEGDIKGCFDNIDHYILIKLLRKTIADRKLTSLIRRFLRAGYIENGMTRKPNKGTPQGGVISPLLANIYLHEMDIWWKEKYYGTLGTRGYRRRTERGNFFLSRYADDFIILSNARKKIVEEMKTQLTKFLLNELKLELSQEKTMVKHATKGFDFLGFHVRKYKKMKGILIHPTKENMQRLRDKIAKILNRRNHSIAIVEMIQVLTPIIRGWANYYKNVNSSKAYNDMDYYLVRKWIRWYRGKFQLAKRKGTRKALEWIKGGNKPILLRHFRDTKIERFRFRAGNPENPPENPYITGKVERRVQENPIIKTVWYGKSQRMGILKLECFVRDGNICRICKEHRERRNLIAHHKKLLSKGGLDELENLVTICKDCNRKYNKLLHYSNISWKEFMRRVMTNGEPYVVKVTSTVRRGGDVKHA